jgi:hypothetical protein
MTMAATGSEQRRLQIMFGILAVLVAVFVFRTFVGGGGGGSDSGTDTTVTTTTLVTTGTGTAGETTGPGPTSTPESTVPQGFGEPNTRNPFQPNLGAGSTEDDS